MTTDSERDLRDGCRLLSQAARLVQRRQDDVLAPLGLTRAALIALEGLVPGALNQEQLAAAVHVRSQTLGKILTRLQVAGFVSRTRHPQDRRQLVVGLTGAGEAAVAAAQEAESTVLPPDIAVRSWKKLRVELDRFVEALQNQERREPYRPSSAATANGPRGSPAVGTPGRPAPPSYLRLVPTTGRSAHVPLRPAVHRSYQIKK